VRECSADIAKLIEPSFLRKRVRECSADIAKLIEPSFLRMRVRGYSTYQVLN